MHHYKYFTVKKWASPYFDRFFNNGTDVVRFYTRCQKVKEIKINIRKEEIYNLHVFGSFKVGIRFRDLMSKAQFYAYLKGVFGHDSRAFTIQQHAFEYFESFNVYKNDHNNLDVFYNSSEEEEEKSSLEDEYDWESIFECNH